MFVSDCVFLTNSIDMGGIFFGLESKCFLIVWIRHNSEIYWRDCKYTMLGNEIEVFYMKKKMFFIFNIKSKQSSEKSCLIIA